MLEMSGWHIANARDVQWHDGGHFGVYCDFEQGEHFDELGFGLGMVLPGQPDALYHREDHQEGFLVLSGEALLIVEGEERPLEAWDYFHCPAGVEHIIVGAGDGPCVVLARRQPRRADEHRLSRRRDGAAPPRRRRAGDDASRRTRTRRSARTPRSRSARSSCRASEVARSVAVTQDELYAALDLELSWSERALPEHVRTKHVHRLHPYHGKFIPQLVEVLLDRYFTRGAHVLDPFAGSGTTLVQALESGLDATGVELAAFNCLLIGVKTARVRRRRARRRAARRVRAARRARRRSGARAAATSSAWYAPQALARARSRSAS